MLNGALEYLLRVKRAQKRALQLTVDAGLMLFSYMGATVLAGAEAALVAAEFWLVALVFVPVSLLIYIRLGFYRAVSRYLSTQLLMTILTGVLASAALVLSAINLMQAPLPFTTALIYALIAMCVLGGLRMALREVLQRHASESRTPVLIFGAGRSGRQLLSSLREQPEFVAVAFADDAVGLHGSEVGGIQIHDPKRLGHVIRQNDIRVVLLAVPSATRAERRKIVERLEKLPVRVQTMPGMTDILSGKARVDELHDVAIEDLLGRDPVPPMEGLMRGNIAGKVVMVTGAGGSIGAELCRQIIHYGPRTLVLWELSELALYTLNNELNETIEAQGIKVLLVPLMGSVQNPGRLAAAMARFQVQTIYHTAAYKHVPLVEQNVVEGLRNNVFGTLAVADCAIDAGVESVILISSDKAVRPTNIMGASKRLAELVCQAAARRQNGTVFSMVRFGNVLGSSGSVIPRFREQVVRGGPVTVTHPCITRYFMTIPEAAQLVIQAGAMATGGDVFVLDMGEPLKIVDLADSIIRLSGLTPYRISDGSGPGKPESKSDTGMSERPEGDIAISFTGLRPGEKLFEELLIGESSGQTEHPRIMTANETCLSPRRLEVLLIALRDACERQNIADLRRIIGSAPVGYTPSGLGADLLGGDEIDLPGGDEDLLPCKVAG